MNFDKLMHYTLMTGLDRFISFSILLFRLRLYSLYCATQGVKEFKIQSVETVSGVYSGIKSGNRDFRETKNDQKVKRIDLRKSFLRLRIYSRRSFLTVP